METYTVVKGTFLIDYVTYTIEANSKEEAIEIAKKGDVDDNNDDWTYETGKVLYDIEN